MKVFFAGVPGGNLENGESRMARLGVNRRLVTYAYRSLTEDQIKRWTGEWYRKQQENLRRR